MMYMHPALFIALGQILIACPLLCPWVAPMHVTINNKLGPDIQQSCHAELSESKHEERNNADADADATTHLKNMHLQVMCKAHTLHFKA